ncbi:solute carrier organic anion transporter family member 4A1-like [Rhipicephalus sanguineus]|uniref:solute carrier organic anion transporter family member 4A1-like n=1 Tax=Rhipicephalus sanguineus TaxID=34632 RepID=UPI0020C22B3F|nr:solute carrier organic anion transporter family member 4A1-like [Rhipicephalus sanguineus]
MNKQEGSESIRDEDTRCGWFGFSPSVAQRFARPQWVLVCFSMAAFAQGMVISGFINVSLPTLERRFHLRSVETGLIVAMYNVGSLLLMAPVTFFGSEMKKPRIMAIGVACMGLGSFIYSLPHFVAPQYKFSRPLKDLCPYVSGPTYEPSGSLRNYRFIFMLANFVHGCSTVPFYTLSVAYMDDNLSAQKSSWYIGIYYTAAIMGPAIGFILGGTFLKTYTDISVDAASIGLSPSSTVWVGAWWIGFVVTGTLALILCGPIFGFPKRLPGAVAVQKPLEVDARALRGDSVQVRLADMPKAVRYLLTNRTFLFISLAATIETMIGSGYSNFAAKLFESEFGMTSANAALLFGMIGIPSACLGCFLGGYVVSKLNLSCASIIRMCIAVSVFNWFVFFALLSSCPDINFEGVDRESKIVLTSKCSSSCACPLSFNPICGRDLKMYMSPCLAGCRNETQDPVAGTTLYTECDCIALEGDSDNDVVEAERVRCTQECSAYFIYMAATFFCLFSTFFISAPGISVTIRCVTAKQKSFALGVQWACIRFLGTIPAPLIFGKTVDMACEIWSSVFNGETNDSGNCAIYNNAALSRNMATLLVLLKTMSVALFACASLSYQPPTSPTS